MKNIGEERPAAVFVPGIFLPADLQYGPLFSVLGDSVQAALKDLEVYASPTPPPDYDLSLEVKGIRRVTDRAGFASFHLVGYSGGGAASLAFTALYPERVRSLALIEAAWDGNTDMGPEDTAQGARFDHVMTLPPEERVRQFMRATLRPGVEPPPVAPAGSPPPWIAQRPAGMEAINRAFKTYSLDRERFRGFHKPVYYALGSLSNPYFERMAHRLARFFPDFNLEVYEGRSHLDPPNRAEPERFAAALLNLWRRAAEHATAASHGR